jgi:hypothetical protein
MPLQGRLEMLHRHLGLVTTNMSSQIQISDGKHGKYELEILTEQFDFMAAVAYQFDARPHDGIGAVDPKNEFYSHSLRFASIPNVLATEDAEEIKQAARMSWKRFSNAETQTTILGIGAGIPTRADQFQPAATQMIHDSKLAADEALELQSRSNYFRETFYYSDYGIEDPRFLPLMKNANLIAAAKTIFPGMYQWYWWSFKYRHCPFLFLAC